MPANDTQRKHLLSSNLKSAITTAAIVGTLGGWAAFGTQQTAVTTTSTAAVTQTADSTGTAAQASTTSQSAAQSPASTTTQSGASQPVAMTRSSR